MGTPASRAAARYQDSILFCSSELFGIRASLTPGQNSAFASPRCVRDGKPKNSHLAYDRLLGPLTALRLSRGAAQHQRRVGDDPPVIVTERIPALPIRCHPERSEGSAFAV